MPTACGDFVPPVELRDESRCLDQYRRIPDDGADYLVVLAVRLDIPDERIIHNLLIYYVIGLHG
jgi:hypothetical protein